MPIDLKSLSRTMLATLWVRTFGLGKIPMIFYLRPTVTDWTDERVAVRIPLRRRSKNHLGSMYFAAMAAGADLACGFLAMAAIRRTKEPVSLVFKSMQADFLQRPEHDVTFVCDDGVLIADLVTKAIETGERVELPIPVRALCKNAAGEDSEVARFTLTLSLKRKEGSKAETPRQERTA